MKEKDEDDGFTIGKQVPHKCPKCKSKSIKFVMDMGSFVMGRNECRWKCEKCQKEWDGLLP